MIGILLISVLVTFLLLLRRWEMRRSIKLGKELSPGIATLPFIGHSYLFIGNNETRMESLKKLGMDAVKNGGLTAFWHCSNIFTVVVDPVIAETVLRTCLEKGDIIRIGRAFIGNGSIFAPAPIWRPRRKVLSQIFRLNHLKQFLSIFSRQSSIMAEQMRNVTGIGTVSVWKFFAGYTMDTISGVTLGYEMNVQRSIEPPIFQTAMDEGETLVAERMLQPWLHNDFIYEKLAAHKKLVNYRDYLWNFTTELIRSMQKYIKEGDKNGTKSDHEDGPKTFLELLIRGAGDVYTEREILEETMVLLIAGNEITALGASYAAVMMSRYLDVQEKVYQEIQEVFGDSDRSITNDDLPRLVYLDAVIRETLRLYPPAPVIVRKVEKDLVLPSGLTLVAGTSAMVNIWAMHRNPRYWGDDAETFRPERFLNAEKNPAFMAFSHGPRNCVGYQFAMISLKTVLSTLVRQYKLLPATDPSSVNPDAEIKSTSEYPPLRTMYGLLMKDIDKFKLRVEPR